MNEFWKQFIPAIITGIIGLSAVILERRKKKAEVESAESSALSSMQAAYTTFVYDLKLNYSELKIKVDKLDDEVLLWKAKYFELKNRINQIDQIDKNDTDIPPTD